MRPNDPLTIANYKMPPRLLTDMRKVRNARKAPRNAGKHTGEVKKLPQRDVDFPEWYNQIVELAGLSDKRYPVKGMNVWTPYGWRAMRSIDALIRQEMERTDHGEVCFPLLIPKTEFEKEAQHIKGFDSEVYWVTHCGMNELEVPLLLRPTSETAMYPMFSLWVRSHSDLPLKTFQIVNTFRYETKQTRSFIRVREIHFFESHTCHVDFEDAEEQIEENLGILKRFTRGLCLPFILTKRPEWDKFAGALYTIGIDTLMPSGRALQLGSIHQYRTNFSEPYNIRYETEEGEHSFVHQTTYGMSERLLGAVIGVHGDDRGLIFPPDVAPYQVVIVPILAKGMGNIVMKAARRLKGELSDAGLRVHLDERDIRPGAKYYYWELRGVPLRVEIGMRDIENNAVFTARRDIPHKAGKKRVVRENVIPELRAILDDISENLLESARDHLEKNIFVISKIEQIGDRQGIFKFPWCGKELCAADVENMAGLKLLGIPVDDSGEEIVFDEAHCAICGKPTRGRTFAARTY